MCKILGIANIRTTLYHLKCDGQVERINCVINKLLSLNVRNPTENWDLNLRVTLIAYRSAFQSSTGYTPYYLLLGREMQLPIDVMYNTTNAEQSG